MQTTNNSLRIKFDGKEYIVDFRETGSGILEVEINGKIHQVSLEDITPHLTDAPKAAATATSPSTVPASQPKVDAAPTASVQTNLVTAPMPGDIVKVCVKIGEEVSIGQELVVLEAMKMKNVIRSPQAGEISAVEVSTGQSVKYGAPLIRFG